MSTLEVVHRRNVKNRSHSALNKVTLGGSWIIISTSAFDQEMQNFFFQPDPRVFKGFSWLVQLKMLTSAQGIK